MTDLVKHLNAILPGWQPLLAAHLGVTQSRISQRGANLDARSIGFIISVLDARSAEMTELRVALTGLAIMPSAHYLSDRQVLEIIPLHTRAEYRKNWLHPDARRALEAAGYASDGKGWYLTS